MHAVGTTTQIGDVGKSLENLRPAELASQPQLRQQHPCFVEAAVARMVDDVEVPTHDPFTRRFGIAPGATQRCRIRRGIDALSLQKARIQHRNHGVDECRRQVLKAQ